MKYLVTGYSSDYIEIEASSPEEAERLGADLLSPPTYWDYFLAVERAEEDADL